MAVRLVTTKTIQTRPGIDHTVKTRIGGLRADERYYYRFETRGAESRVGRFQTALPADSEQPVRFAFFSCQEYAHGFYNAHAAMAKEDLDFVVCLGDYIYAEVYTSTKEGNGVRGDVQDGPQVFTDPGDRLAGG